jgi:DNA processing protein
VREVSGTSQSRSWPAASLPPDPERACARCLTRSWLIARLSGFLERAGADIEAVLVLRDEELIAAIAGRHMAEVTAELESLDIAQLRARTARAGIEPICHCDAGYPAGLRELDAPPAVLHVIGGLDRTLGMLARETVAIVGTRRASGYGLEVARSLGRGLAAAGVTVVSGMALGIDSAAHAGALAGRGATVAVLPGGADRPYPVSRRGLYARIASTGAVISELPAGAPIRRWSPPARNRIIAALAAVTVVVEASEQSGALLTADRVRALGRLLAAIPGRVTSPLATGPNGLIRSGATLVRSAQDVLDELFGEGAVRAVERVRPPLAPELDRLLRTIGEGHDSLAALASAGLAAEEVLVGLSQLELAGYIRREAGGRFSVLP